MIRLFLSALLTVAPILTKADVTASAIQWPEPVKALVQDAQAECGAIMGGNLEISADAVDPVPMGDTLLWVVDTFHMRCSTLPSLFCGTGGCSLHLVAGDHQSQHLSKGWQFVEMGPLSVILLQIHGSECGGTNLIPCVEALAWDDTTGTFTTLRPPLD
ncbi:MAG: hypothetical protein AAGF71_11785 [Pseudomonadota bacterium]